MIQAALLVDPVGLCPFQFLVFTTRRESPPRPRCFVHTILMVGSVGKESSRPREWRSVQIVLAGRLARDPDLRTVGEGVPRAWFVLAVPRGSAGPDGDREADFISIVAWRQLASTVAEHLAKGRLVGVAGRLRISEFEGQDGTRRTTTEVVADQVIFLDAPRKPKGQSDG